MTVVFKEEEQVSYELSNRLKRRAHIRAMLLRAKNALLKGDDKQPIVRPTSD
jgi:hypothetical protein